MLETKSPNERWPWMVEFALRKCTIFGIINQSFDPTDNIGKLK